MRLTHEAVGPAEHGVTHALSFLQPWLWAMVVPPVGLRKTVENRNWRPPAWVIGRRIALHASKGYDAEAIDTMRRINGPRFAVPQKGARCLGHGHIVATAVVSDYYDADDLTSRTRAADPWAFGRFCWLLTDIVALTPVPAKGALGLWRMPIPIEAVEVPRA